MLRVAGYLLLAVAILVANAPALAASGARQSLARSLPETKIDAVALSDALDFIRDVSGANIHVNWRALEDAGIGKDAIVSLHVRNVSLRKVLSLVLGEAGSGNLLTYFVDDNVIEVTTRALADQQLITRVYPVDDLILDVPDFIAPSFQLSTSTATKGGGGSQSLIGNADANQSAASTRAGRAQQLIDTIQAVVQPEVWNVNGGPAAIRFLNGSLIVTAPRSVHESLDGDFD